MEQATFGRTEIAQLGQKLDSLDLSKDERVVLSALLEAAGRNVDSDEYGDDELVLSARLHKVLHAMNGRRLQVGQFLVPI